MSLNYFRLLLILFMSLARPNYVTYYPTGARLGDQLIGCMHAMWIAYRYGFQFVYNSFPYSDKLVLNDIGLKQSTIAYTIIKTLQVGQSLDQLIDPKDKNVLYVVPYFPESTEELLPTDVSNCAVNFWHRQENLYPYFKVDWKDLGFKKILQKFFKPNYNIKLVKVPKDVISIAIHVRKNSNGFDLPLLHGRKENEYDENQVYVDVVFPLKHPPEDYYIEQLQALLNIISTSKKTYVYLFTDDPYPGLIIDNFKAKIKNSNVDFDYNKIENNHYTNVLEDLFSMIQFDYFIRPDSNLSIVASKIGDFNMVISPAHHRWEGTNLVIDRVDINL